MSGRYLAYISIYRLRNLRPCYISKVKVLAKELTSFQFIYSNWIVLEFIHAFQHVKTTFKLMIKR